MKWIYAGLVVALLLIGYVVVPACAAQEHAKVGDLKGLSEKPLSLDDKKDLRDAAKDVEIWTLRAQNAALELDRAKAALDRLAASKTPVGYQIIRTPTGDLMLSKIAEKPKETK